MDYNLHVIDAELHYGQSYRYERPDSWSKGWDRVTNFRLLRDRLFRWAWVHATPSERLDMARANCRG